MGVLRIGGFAGASVRALLALLLLGHLSGTRAGPRLASVHDLLDGLGRLRLHLRFVALAVSSPPSASICAA